METCHGAVKKGLGKAKLGKIGGGMPNAGTVQTVDTMGTGRAYTPGAMTPVLSGVKKNRKK